MINIVLEDYTWKCGDGCCSDHGIRVIIDGKVITGVSSLYEGEHIISAVLDHLKIEHTIERTYEDNE